MLINYIKIAFRTILKNKLHSFINIMGLSIGITCSILVLLLVRDLLSYDKHYSKHDRIYMVQSKSRPEEKERIYYETPFPIGPVLKDEYPVIEASVRIFAASSIYFYDQKREIIGEDEISYADPDVFKVFDHKFIYGSPEGALDKPKTIVLSESLSKKYFGEENPVGEYLSRNNGDDYKVTGVFEDLPLNTFRRYDALISMTGFELTSMQWDINSREPRNFFRQLGNNSTFILLSENTNIATITDTYDRVRNKYYGEYARQNNRDFEPVFQPLTDVFLYYKNDPSKPPDALLTIYLLSLLAVLIMSVACINYMNLSTARYSGRAREVGVRKVLGANRASLIRQFLCESVFITVVALLIALMLVELFLPVLNDFLGKELTFNVIGEMGLFLGIFIITLIVGIMSGSYPAFFLSSFLPSKVIKGEIKSRKGKGLLRKVLVVIQFVISIIIIISTIMVKEQIDYMLNMDLGFNKDNIMVAYPGNPEVFASIPAFTEEILRNNDVLAVAQSNTSAGQGKWQWTCEVKGSKGEKIRRTFNFGLVDYNFIDLMEMEIIDGRSFNKEMGTDQSTAVLVNETLVKEVGWTDSPIGKQITMGQQNRKVIGVVKDFYFQSLKTKLEPMILMPGGDGTMGDFDMPLVSIKIRPENTKETVAFIEKKWSEMNPIQPFEYNFLEEVIDSQYDADERFARILYYSAFLSIFISCLGLFGLSSFVAEKKTKEIGIRKAHGASILNVFYHLAFDFIKLILISGAIAWGILIFALIRLSEYSPYKPEGFPWGFVIAVVITIVLALMTVSYHAVKASMADPVKALRYE